MTSLLRVQGVGLRRPCFNIPQGVFFPTEPDGRAPVSDMSLTGKCSSRRSSIGGRQRRPRSHRQRSDWQGVTSSFSAWSRGIWCRSPVSGANMTFELRARGVIAMSGGRCSSPSCRSARSLAARRCTPGGGCSTGSGSVPGPRCRGGMCRRITGPDSVCVGRESFSPSPSHTALPVAIRRCVADESGPAARYVSPTAAHRHAVARDEGEQ